MAACRHFQEWTERRKKTETTFSRFEHKMWKFGRKCKFFFIRFFPVFFFFFIVFLLWFFNVLNSLCHKIVDCSLLIIREMKKKAHGEWKNRAHYCCAGLFWSLQPFSRSVQVARSYQNISLFHVLIHSGHSWHCTPAHHITRSHSHRNSLNA